MFPDEDLTPDDFVEIDGDIGYFRTPGGDRVSVDLRESPYARRVAAEAMVRRSGGEPRMGSGAQASMMSAPTPAARPVASSTPRVLVVPAFEQAPEAPRLQWISPHTQERRVRALFHDVRAMHEE